MVRDPNPAAFSASTITCLISLIPESTAENSMKLACVRCAMIFASVVFPVPGGPQKIIETASSLSMASRSGLPGASRCSCPTYSSSVRGRILSASGACRPCAAAAASGLASNRLIVPLRKPQRLSVAKPHTAAATPRPPRSSSRPDQGRESSRLRPPSPATPPPGRLLHCQSSAHKLRRGSHPAQPSRRRPPLLQQPATAHRAASTPQPLPPSHQPPARETRSPHWPAEPSGSRRSRSRASSAHRRHQTPPPTVPASPDFRGLATPPQSESTERHVPSRPPAYVPEE